MDYSNVTSKDLYARLNDLVQRQIALEWERQGNTKEMDDIHDELARRAQGTTDDSAERQNVGVR